MKCEHCNRGWYPAEVLLPVKKEVEQRLEELEQAIENIQTLKQDIGYFGIDQQVHLENLSERLEVVADEWEGFK